MTVNIRTGIGLCCALVVSFFVAAAPIPTERAQEIQKALLAWFECVECVDGELEKLDAYGVEIEAALITTLENGLSPAKRAELAHRLRIRHETISDPASGPYMTLPEYIAEFTENVETGYQSRAATALGRLNTPNARAALQRAIDLPTQRAVVRQAARESLQP